LYRFIPKTIITNFNPHFIFHKEILSEEYQKSAFFLPIFPIVYKYSNKKSPSEKSLGLLESKI
jgi:hypothetical protein